MIIGPGDNTGSATRSFYRETEVLADMPGISVEDYICPFAVPPHHPVWDVGPDKNHAAPEDYLLIETGTGDTVAIISVPAEGRDSEEPAFIHSYTFIR
jgi:hypothetical protein